MTITASAMLVELNISTWAAQKTAKQVTDEVLANNGAAHNAGLFKKHLLAGANKRKEIADYAQGCRHWHGVRTLPWLDKGGRLLPTSLFFDYKTEANTRRDTFNQMVEDFLVDYPSLVTQAQTNLGSLFDAADYPSADEVRGKFGFRLVFSPVPEAGDFRVDVGNADMEELKQQYEASFNERLTEATMSSWERLHELISNVSLKLTDAPGSEKNKRYHDSLLGNAHELCGMLTHLNVAKDPKLEEARRLLEHAICGVDMDDIRLDPAMRGAVKKDMDAILGDYW